MNTKYLSSKTITLLLTICMGLLLHGCKSLDSVHKTQDDGLPKLSLSLSIDRDTVFLQDEPEEFIATVVLANVSSENYVFAQRPILREYMERPQNLAIIDFSFKGLECRIFPALVRDVSSIKSFRLKKGQQIVLRDRLDIQSLFFWDDYTYPNQHYGPYVLQASFFTQEGDTLVSNSVTVWYLEKPTE